MQNSPGDGSIYVIYTQEGKKIISRIDEIFPRRQLLIVGRVCCLPHLTPPLPSPPQPALWRGTALKFILRHWEQVISCVIVCTAARHARLRGATAIRRIDKERVYTINDRKTNRSFYFRPECSCVVFHMNHETHEREARASFFFFFFSTIDTTRR